MTSVSCRVWPSRQHKCDPHGTRGDPQFDMPGVGHIVQKFLFSVSKTWTELFAMFGSGDDVYLAGQKFIAFTEL